MKKIITIVITICQFIFLTAYSQERNSVYKKRQQFCSADVTMMNGSHQLFALGGFCDDSLVVFPFSTVNNHLQVWVGQQKKITADSIKQVKIRVKTIKNAPDIYSETASWSGDTRTVSASHIDGTNPMGSVGNALIDVASVSGEAFVVTTIASVVLLPVIIPIAILSDKEKTYHINGQVKRLHKMERRLTK